MTEKDAFGQMLYAYLKGRDVPEFVERDDGFLDVGKIGPRNYFGGYKEWPEIERKAIRFAKGRVVDIGSGAGRVELYLQKKGLKATGIDISPLAIKVCKLRGVKDIRKISISEMGKRFRNGYFDTVVMFGNNFGLFGNPKRARSILGQFHKVTSPDALIIAETIDPYKTDKRAHLDYHKRNRAKGRLGGQIRIRIRFENLIGAWFDYLFVSRSEMKEMLKGTGWKVKNFISSGGSMYIAVIGKSSDS